MLLLLYPIRSFNLAARANQSVMGVIDRDYKDLEQFTHILHHALVEVKWPKPLLTIDLFVKCAVKRGIVEIKID